MKLVTQPLVLALTVPFILSLAAAPGERPAAAPAAQTPAAGAPAATPPAAPPNSATRAIVRAEKPAYPLATCVVGGEPLTKDALDDVVDGHLVRVCSATCAETVRKDPAKFRELVVAAVVTQQKPAYPLTTCPVTGEPLGESAVDHVHGTKLVRLKDTAARAEFEKAPAAPLAKLDQAWIAALSPAYRASKCPVMGDRLDAKAKNVLYGTRLVRLCCAGCVRKFEADPEKYLAVLDAAK